MNHAILLSDFAGTKLPVAGHTLDLGRDELPASDGRRVELRHQAGRRATAAARAAGLPP